jgi:hypothetical protein
MSNIFFLCFGCGHRQVFGFVGIAAIFGITSQLSLVVRSLFWVGQLEFLWSSMAPQISI